MYTDERQKGSYASSKLKINKYIEKLISISEKIMKILETVHVSFSCC